MLANPLNLIEITSCLAIQTHSFTKSKSNYFTSIMTLIRFNLEFGNVRNVYISGWMNLNSFQHEMSILKFMFPSYQIESPKLAAKNSISHNLFGCCDLGLWSFTWNRIPHWYMCVTWMCVQCVQCACVFRVCIQSLLIEKQTLK